MTDSTQPVFNLALHLPIKYNADAALVDGPTGATDPAVIVKKLIAICKLADSCDISYVDALKLTVNTVGKHCVLQAVKE